MKIYTGKTRCEGNRLGNICIIQAGESLRHLINKDVTYTLIVDENKKESKSNEHKIELIKQNYGKRLYDVKSSSGDEYIVDINLGCGCASYSISGNQICSHMLAVLKHILIENSSPEDSIEQEYEGDL